MRAIFFLLIFFAFLIHFRFFLPNCYLFDGGDDAGHTFFNLKNAWDIWRSGHIPFINIRNNFGTPFLGDSLGGIFSPLSISYFIMPMVYAAAFNKLLLAFLTPLIFYKLFLRWMNSYLAFGMAILVFLNPGFFWHAAHHHYQMALFCYGLILYSNRNLVAIGGSFLLLTLSCNWNVIGIFLISYLLFLYSQKFPFKMFCKIVAILFFVIALNSFDLLEFYRQLSEAFRVQQGYEPSLAQGGPFSPMLFMRFLFLRGHHFHQGHLNVALFLSIPLYVVNFYLIIKTFKWLSPLLKSWIRAGLCTSLLVYFLFLVYPLWWKIPFIASTDISRFLWFSMVPLYVGFGMACEHWFSSRSKKILLVLVIVPCLITTSQILRWDQPLHCSGSHYYGPLEQSLFSNPKIINFLEPNSRVVIECDTRFEQSPKLVANSFFGGDGRTVLLNGPFFSKLENFGLATKDSTPLTYHFIAAGDEDIYARYGIRYFITPTLVTNKSFLKGFKLKQKLNGVGCDYTPGTFYLYENVKKPSLSYFLKDGKPIFIRDYSIEGNELNIPIIANMWGLPLTVTFTYRPGWAVYDEKFQKIPLVETAEGLMQIIVPKDSKKILWRYHPLNFN